MLSTESGPVLRLTVNPSALLLVAVTLMHVAALCSIGMIDISIPWQIILILIIWLSGVCYWFRYWQSPRINQIEWHDSSRIILFDAQQAYRGALRKVHCLYPWMVAFTVCDSQGTKQQCLLLKDQTDPDAFRRLTVQLRFATTEVADAD